MSAPPDVVALEGATTLATMALLGALTSLGAYHVATGAFGFRPDVREAAVRVKTSGGSPLVTFVVTAYRDADQVVPCLKAILGIDHPEDRLRIVVVADEDDEGTLDVLKAHLAGPDARYARNREGDEVVRAGRVTAVLQRGERAGRGKPRALQNALRYVPREGFVGVVDADHLLAPDFLKRTLPSFDDPRVGIVQARRAPKVLDREWLATWDIFEQNVGRIQAYAARDRVGSSSFYGSTGLVRAELLHEVGWGESLAEDTLLDYDLRERGYRVAFVTTTYSLEDHVTRLRHYVRQRRRWAAGHMQVFFAKFGSTLRSRAPLATRLDSVYHLSYFFGGLLLVQYWLLRGTHYWLQRPEGAWPTVAALSVGVGAAVAAAEWWQDRRARPAAYGFVAASLIAFGILSLIVAHVKPAPRLLPVPLALELAVFAAPLVPFACGYLNPDVRLPARDVETHFERWAVVLALAVPMLIVNLYATLTGVLVSLEPRPAWVKTVRRNVPS